MSRYSFAAVGQGVTLAEREREREREREGGEGDRERPPRKTSITFQPRRKSTRASRIGSSFFAGYLPNVA